MQNCAEPNWFFSPGIIYLISAGVVNLDNAVCVLAYGYSNCSFDPCLYFKIPSWFEVGKHRGGAHGKVVFFGAVAMLPCQTDS